MCLPRRFDPGTMWRMAPLLSLKRVSCLFSPCEMARLRTSWRPILALSWDTIWREKTGFRIGITREKVFLSLSPMRFTEHRCPEVNETEKKSRKSEKTGNLDAFPGFSCCKNALDAGFFCLNSWSPRWPLSPHCQISLVHNFSCYFGAGSCRTDSLCVDKSPPDLAKNPLSAFRHSVDRIGEPEREEPKMLWEIGGHSHMLWRWGKSINRGARAKP